ncbi:MAG: ABC transporter ATP-binding protein, partial [Candidatus Syntrophonatronum acetioxidans]
MGFLKVQDLGVTYISGDQKVRALDRVTFSLKEGETLGVIGESGSGKTTMALALMGLIGKKDLVEGTGYFQGKEFLSLREQEKAKIRWKDLAMVFQNSLEVLNPVLNIKEQVAEPLIKHLNLKGEELKGRVEELLQLVGLDISWKEAYPHQLSGGMRQRVLLAMALSCKPKVLLVDEPTTSLDPVSRKEILDLLERLQEEYGFTMVLISHDLSCIARLTSHLLVFYNGRVVEEGKTPDILEESFHPYTRGLINSSPNYFAYRDLWGIPGEGAWGEEEGCSFNPRCSQTLASCRERAPQLEEVAPGRRVSCHRGGIVTLLQAEDLGKEYRLKKRVISAVNGVSLRVREGEVVGLVGETGSGKSTVAQILGRLIKPTGGEVTFQGEAFNGKVTRREGGIQIIMQDPFSSTSHRLTVEQVIREPLEINRIGSRQEREERIREALKGVQLPWDPAFLGRFAFELSGGQRQRVAIARALVMR